MSRHLKLFSKVQPLKKKLTAVAITIRLESKKTKRSLIAQFSLQRPPTK